MSSFVRNSAIILALLLFTGCGAATQNIPVSTEPSGAIVYVDGTETCTTPCNATLEKTQDHILTIKKDGYRQADVPIVRKYDTTGVARDATQSGMRSSSMGSNTQGAIANALMTAGAKEEQGTAYILTPSTVTVKLAKKGQTAPQAAGQDGPVYITSDQLAPEDQKAVIKTTEPTTLGSAVQENPAEAAEALLEAGAVAAPTVHTGKEWKSSHSSESYGSDGSYNKTTKSSGVSVGASVNPVAAGLGILHLLEDANKDTEDKAQPAE
ncbi:MAG: PEGA domain-containing protein [Pseudodesulfovibrio sp.]|nr:PEGA domain-containing protein [Pseudodesulfovibrio sp.]